LIEFDKLGAGRNHIKTCGISNQRETFLLWNRQGKPLYNAIVWQCRRSVRICERWKSEGWQKQIKNKTGLLIDPYFSASKLVWLYENVNEIRNIIEEGNAFFGTVDAWLLYRLTKENSYLTDYTNASRTLLFNLSTLDWDRELLEAFKLSKLNLPQAKPSSSLFGETDFCGLLKKGIPVTAMIGDSHAAAFGEGCFSPGAAKATLGTGCSVLMNIGQDPKASANGMVTTVCWSTEERIDFALEGVIVSCGSTIEWLKNEIGLFNDSILTESMAAEVPDNNGVYIVPAFSGLGAPHWDMNRKGSITGLSFTSNKNHVVRAALESIAYQIKDVVVAMEADSKIELQELMVNGGISSNGFVLQFLADLLDRPVINSGMPDVSALGAAYLAGLKAGVYKNLDQLKTLNADKHIIEPQPNEKIKNWYSQWKEIIEVDGRPSTVDRKIL
jgi:glycerol kinase